MDYKAENDLLLQNFMERTFFTAWKRNKCTPENLKVVKQNEIFYGNYSHLEMQLNPYCDLDCLYCYEQKYGDEYFPQGTTDKKKVLHNVDLLLDYLVKNDYTPVIELFSGDPLVQDLGHDVIDKILDRAEKGQKITDFISIPTNMGVLLHPKRLERLENNIARANKLGVRIGLSASVDGLYMEENRPFKRPDKFKRDDKFYDDLFKFAKKYGIGFHPMIYSNNMKDWKKNFLWFQSKFEEYDLPWRNIYLLEVRNIEWTTDELEELYEFCKWLVGWTINKLNGDVKAYGVGNFFNILGGGLSQNGRGIGCSIQSTPQIRMGDLSWGLCHRLMYDKYVTGRFKVENDEIVGVESLNVEAQIGMGSASTTNFPYCENCLLKYTCSAGCLGSNYESTGDPFTTHPSVCRAEHYKFLGLLHGMRDNGILPNVQSMIHENKNLTIEQFKKFGLL